MADQRISLPVAPKSTDSSTGNSRRHSLANASPSKSDKKAVPNYLRASTGSCHDFCKFGKHHEFEEKARPPFRRRNAKKPPDEHGVKEFQLETLSRSKGGHKSSSSSRTPPDTPEIIKREVPKKPVHRKTPTPNVTQKKVSSGALLTKSADNLSPMLREILDKKKTVAKNVLTESVDSQISVYSDNWAEKRKSSLRETNKSSVVNHKTSPNSKTPLSRKSIKPGVYSSSEKTEVSLKQASPKVKEDKDSAKRAKPLKAKLSSTDSSKVSSVQSRSGNKIAQKMLTSKSAVKGEQTSARGSSSPKISRRGISREVASPRASSSLKSTVRVQITPRASLSRKPSLKKIASLNTRRQKSSELASPLKKSGKISKASSQRPKIKNGDREQSIKEVEGPNVDLVTEKTLYVIKTESENKYLDSERKEDLSNESFPPPLLAAESPSLVEVPSSSSNNEDEEDYEYTASDAEDDYLSEYDETEYMEEADVEEAERRGWHRMGGMMPSQDKNDEAIKLRFRRGKVIDIQPEHNSPRRLKFRRGRVLGDNQNLKGDGRRSFKRRGAEDLTKVDSDSVKVVLRHQDVHGKKDAQGLFNNVIEETASKLVESRKSKVKALVGAFETVISLQDSKPPVSSAS